MMGLRRSCSMRVFALLVPCSRNLLPRRSAAGEYERVISVQPQLSGDRESQREERDDEQDPEHPPKEVASEELPFRTSTCFLLLTSAINFLGVAGLVLAEAFLERNYLRMCKTAPIARAPEAGAVAVLPFGRHCPSTQGRPYKSRGVLHTRG